MADVPGDGPLCKENPLIVCIFIPPNVLPVAYARREVRQTLYPESEQIMEEPMHCPQEEAK